MKKNQIVLNLFASILFFAVNLSISFFITPLIVNKLGAEAYGFIGLTNNIVNYASVATAAVNSVSGRFLIIKLNQNDIKGANEYFNSIFLTNLIMSAILSVFSLVTVINIQHVMNIPQNLITDVRITFALTALNFIITLIITIFTTAAYVVNRTDISSVINIESTVARIIVLVILFCIFKPRIFFIAISALGFTLFSAAENIKYTRKLLPNIKLDFSLFKINRVKDVFSLGIWNSVNSMSQILIDGMDLFIINLFIGSSVMGFVSISKSIPNILVSFITLIAWVYEPKFTIMYAKNNFRELMNTIKQSMYMTIFIAVVPITGVIIFGYDFYKLWLPALSEDTILLIQQLTIISIIPSLINSLNRSLNNMFVVLKKLKMPVIITLLTGIISLIIVFICLKYTSFGVYAVVGVSSVFLSMEYLIFTPLYAAHVLNVSKKIFLKYMLTGMMYFVIIFSLFYIVRRVLSINSWINFLCVIFLCVCLGYLSGYFILFTKSQRKEVLKLICRKISILMPYKNSKKEKEENFEKGE